MCVDVEEDEKMFKEIKGLFGVVGVGGVLRCDGGLNFEIIFEFRRSFSLSPFVLKGKVLKATTQQEHLRNEQS